jgi:GDP-L-fucose synthase
METNDIICVLGSNGTLGKSLIQHIQDAGYHNILSPPRSELDLTSYDSVRKYIERNKPKYVILSAAKVSGISDQMLYPADHAFINGSIILNVFEACAKNMVEKTLFISSATIYPRDCPNPIKEESIYTGMLDTDVEMYGLTKLLGTRMCHYYSKQYKTKFVCCVPSNIYGPYCNLYGSRKHVIASLIEKIHNAKIHNHPSITVWGDGNARREFIYSGDLAECCLFILNSVDSSNHINVGTGEDFSIKQLVEVIKRVVDYECDVIWDTSKPSGNGRRLLDSSKINNMGWNPKHNLENGVKKTYEWYMKEIIK